MNSGLKEAYLLPEHMRKNEEVDEGEIHTNSFMDHLPRLGIRAFCAVGIVFICLMISVAIGVYPRIALLLAIVAYMFFFRTVIWSSKVVRKTSLIPWTCLLLTVIPDDPAMQSLSVLAIKVLLVQMWFSAALWKIPHSWKQWVKGNALRYNLIREAIQNTPDSEHSKSVRIAMMPAVVPILSTLVLLIELFSPAVLLADTVLLCAISYAVFLLFHLGIYYTWRLDYLSFCFIPVGAILLIPSTYPFAEIFPAAFQDWRSLLTMAVILLMVSNLFLKLEIWPLHTWPMFKSAPEFADLKLHRLVAYHDNTRTVIQSKDRYLNRNIGRHGPYLRWFGEHWAKSEGIDPASIERLDLELLSVSEDLKTLQSKTLTSFIRLTQLARWRWLPPWEEHSEAPD